MALKEVGRTARSGFIVHVAPDAREVFRMHGAMVFDEMPIGSLVEDGGADAVRIGATLYRFAPDPRLRNGRVAVKGPYLVFTQA